MPRHPLRNLEMLLEQADIVITLVVAAICSVLSFLGIVTQSILGGLVLAILALVAYASMRDRSARDKITKRLDQLEGNVLLDNFFQRDTNEAPLIQDAEDEIYIVRQTGNFTFEMDGRLFQGFLERNRNGMIGIVVTAPTQLMLDQIALRNNLDEDRIRAQFTLAQSEPKKDQTERLQQELNASLLLARHIPLDGWKMLL